MIVLGLTQQKTQKGVLKVRYNINYQASNGHSYDPIRITGKAQTMVEALGKISDSINEDHEPYIKATGQNIRALTGPAVLKSGYANYHRWIEKDNPYQYTVTDDTMSRPIYHTYWIEKA